MMKVNSFKDATYFMLGNGDIVKLSDGKNGELIVQIKRNKKSRSYII